MAASPSATLHRSRPRKARGQDRPQYLESTDLDRVFIMLTGLMAEVSALRDRLDTHEALAAGNRAATTEAVEGFTLTPALRTQRDQRRDAMLDRLLRVLSEERDHQEAEPA